MRPPRPLTLASRALVIGPAALVAAAAPLLLAAPRSARADDVWLKNGATITGKATETGSEVVIAVRGGVLRIPASMVDRVVHAPMPDELFAARAATTDLEDPAAARALARYARQLGMEEAASRIERTSDEIELETRLARIDQRDAEALRGLAWWARARGLGPEVQRYLLAKAITAAPADPETRAALSRLDQEEAAHERRRAEEAERAAREQAAAERAALEADLARARAEAERLRAEAELEREKRLAAERAPRPPQDGWVGSGREVYGPTIIIRRGGRGRGNGPVFVPAPGPVPTPNPHPRPCAPRPGPAR